MLPISASRQRFPTPWDDACPFGIVVPWFGGIGYDILIVDTIQLRRAPMLSITE
jgi:hypothetical protein